MKKVQIFKVEYTISTRRDENWIAYVAAYNSDSAIKYVARFVKNGRIVVTTMDIVSRLDGVTDEVRKLIAQPLLPVGKEKKEEDNEATELTPQRKKSIVPKD